MLPSRVATDEEIGLLHTPEPVDLARELSKVWRRLLNYGDTPAFKGVYEALAITVGASLDAVVNVQADHEMNISGGLHHAHEDGASGFCVFKDPAVSIAYLKKSIVPRECSKSRTGNA
jgi:acetoin utilization protein AcuC